LFLPKHPALLEALRAKLARQNKKLDELAQATLEATNAMRATQKLIDENS
jgi:hypothetical protein